MAMPFAKYIDRLRHSQHVTRLKLWSSKSFQDLQSKGSRYWVLAGFLIPIGMLIGHALGSHSFWVSARYYVYDKMQNVSAHRLNASTETVVVLIGDEEWNGDLARRSPLKADYLACLIEKLDQAQPRAIALDIDLAFHHPDYQREKSELLAALKGVSSRRPVVIAQPIAKPPAESGMSPPPIAAAFQEPSVFSDYKHKNLRFGHVLLPKDVRQVPLSLSLRNGDSVPSFAAVIAHALDPTAIQDAQSVDNSLPYGTFIPPEQFKRVSAKQVFATDVETLNEFVRNEAVLVGGAWRVNSFEDRRIDVHPTPVGEIGGVFVHANYVEALLSHRVTKPVGKWFGIVVEFLMAAFIAVVFAWNMTPSRKFGWAVAFSLSMVVMAYLFWQNLGLFFDFFIPLVLLGAHAFVAQVIEWRNEANAHKPALAGIATSIKGDA